MMPFFFLLSLHFLFYILLHPAECRLVLATCDNTVCLAVTAPWLVSAKNKNQQFVPLLLLMRLTSTHIVLTSTSTSGTTSTPAGPGGSSCLLLLLMIDITPLVLTSASASTSCIPAGPGPGSFLLCLSPPLLLSSSLRSDPQLAYLTLPCSPATSPSWCFLHQHHL